MSLHHPAVSKACVVGNPPSRWASESGLHRPEEGASVTAEGDHRLVRDLRAGSQRLPGPSRDQFRDHLPEAPPQGLAACLEEEERQKLVAGAPAAAPTARDTTLLIDDDPSFGRLRGMTRTSSHRAVD